MSFARKNKIKRPSIPPRYRVKQATKLDLAEQIIKETVGPDACRESRVRLARRYKKDQLKALLICVKTL